MIPAIGGKAQIGIKGRRQLQGGHPWVYRSDLTRAPACPAGLVYVQGPDGERLGCALYSPASQISLRMLTTGDEAVTEALLGQRLEAARARRRRLMPNAEAWRWVHGEADFLPGIFIDCYADCLVLQTTCGGADVLLPVLQALLLQLAAPRALVLRNEGAMRAREGLPRRSAVLHGTAPVKVNYREGAITYSLDLLHDHKTGSFLDQAQNHQRAAAYAQGVGLDAFCYHGGFALQLASGCSSVLGLDSARPAVARAIANAVAAGLSHVRFEVADVFARLPQLVEAGAQFDTIVLDPPAFASTAGTLPAALRAYREINRRAMQLLRPHGILISCSCSGRVGEDAFDAALAAAGRVAGRRLHQIESWPAAPDHPALLGVPETRYLKARVLMVL